MSRRLPSQSTETSLSEVNEIGRSLRGLRSRSCYRCDKWKSNLSMLGAGLPGVCPRQIRERSVPMASFAASIAFPTGVSVHVTSPKEPSDFSFSDCTEADPSMQATVRCLQRAPCVFWQVPSMHGPGPGLLRIERLRNVIQSRLPGKALSLSSISFSALIKMTDVLFFL